MLLGNGFVILVLRSSQLLVPAVMIGDGMFAMSDVGSKLMVVMIGRSRAMLMPIVGRGVLIVRRR